MSFCQTGHFLFDIISLKKVFEGIVQSKIQSPLNPYLKTDVTSLLILFFVKDFKEKEIEFLTELLLQKDDNKCAYDILTQNNKSFHSVILSENNFVNLLSSANR